MLMRPAYDTIVIGSGFGGSVTACRMAQAGFAVGLFERGRSYETNPFPRDWNNINNGWLWSARSCTGRERRCHRMSLRLLTLENIRTFARRGPNRPSTTTPNRYRSRVA